MITKGQARRIAASWHAANNACSWLSHKGVIKEDLLDELVDNMAAVRKNPRAYVIPGEDSPKLAMAELKALVAFAKKHGPGKVSGWGAWDDTPVAV